MQGNDGLTPSSCVECHSNKCRDPVHKVLVFLTLVID